MAVSNKNELILFFINYHSYINTSFTNNKTYDSSIFTLEYVINKKPVIFFGNSWLDSCPGVYRCQNADDCNNIMKKIVNLDYKIEESQIFNFFKKWSVNLFNLNNYSEEKKNYVSNLFLNCLKLKNYRQKK